MTKKSPARIARDIAAKQSTERNAEFLKTNTAWNELNELYTTIAGGMANTWAHVVSQFAIPEVRANLSSENYDELKALMDGMKADVESFADELVAIRQSHVNKTGGSATEEDFQDTVTIYEQYVSIQERIGGVLFPTSQTVLEHVAVAITKTAVIEVEQDTAVVSDVQVKSEV